VGKRKVRPFKSLDEYRAEQGGEYKRTATADDLMPKLIYCEVISPDGLHASTSTELGKEQDALDDLERGLRQYVKQSVQSTNEGDSNVAKKATAVKKSGWGSANGASKPDAKVKAKKEEKGAKVAKLASKSLTRKGAYDPEAKITVLAKENPRRPGTHGHKVFASYSRLKTVGKVIEAGGKVADLKWDEDHESIKIG
jgi:hypothetical protein